jgi:hypothetical protein
LFDDALRPAGRLTVPVEPTVLESTGDGMSLLVGGAFKDNVGLLLWLDRANGAQVLAAPLRGPARAVVMHNDGNTVFVLTAGSPGGLSIVRTATLEERRWIGVCDDPQSLVFTREGDQGYATCAPGRVAEIDPKLEFLVRTAFIGADSGRACGAGRSALSPNGTLLLIPCAVTGRLLYVDRVTLQPWDSADVGPGISAVAATPGGVAVVLQPDSDRVLLVDLGHHASLATIATPPAPVDVALSARGRTAFVVCAGRAGGPGALLELDTHDGAVRANALLPPGARALYVWPGRRNSRLRWAAAPHNNSAAEPPQPAP